jgi:hypothetical protein
MLVQVNGHFVLTRPFTYWTRSHLFALELVVLTYFAVFSAIAICVGWLIARFYAWRQSVLYGMRVGGGSVLNRRAKDARLSSGRWLQGDPDKVAVSPDQTANRSRVEAVE